jgi:protein-disulfide isomerase
MYMKNIQKQQGDIMVPVAIIIAAIIIGLAVMFTNKNTGENNDTDLQLPEETGQVQLDPITSQDHIRGDINAVVKIVEYSDLDCPFCQRFHQTMKQITSEYGSDKVAWVYRNSPIYPKSFGYANATECVAEIGGEEKFWQYLDLLYSRDDKNLDVGILESYAQQVGVDVEPFKKCQDEMRYKDKLNINVAGMAKAGGGGTPHSILVAPNGELIQIMGAQPIESVKSLIEQALSIQ